MPNNQECACCHTPLGQSLSPASTPKLPKLGKLGKSLQPGPKLIRTGDFSGFPSPKYIEGARVGSCNKVVMKKGKQSTAIPFYSRKAAKNSVPSSFYNSWSHEIHTLHVNQHAGMQNKHLIPYSPQAMRNRLQHAGSPVMAKNNSQFEIGNRGKPFAKRFMTTYKTHFTRKDNADQVSHLGILCNRTIWQHRQLEAD